MSSTAQDQLATTGEQCPYCGHPITHDELHTIEARIAEEEQKKFNEREVALKKKWAAKHLAETSELRKSLAAKDVEAKKLETAARLAGRKAAEEELAAQTAALKKKKKALAAGTVKLEAEHLADKRKQRKLLEAKHEKDLLQQKADSDKVNYRLKKKMEDVQRQLEQKSNEQLGDGAEIDVFNELKAAFPDDVINRVKKGAAGADIVHEVHIDGRACGKIVYDSKNREQWRDAYVEQLRQDQLAEKADYAVLPTRKFGRDVREMGQQDGVIIINPARVVVIANVLRDFIEQLSRTRLSEQDRKAKRDKLYAFLTSQRCTDLFARLEQTLKKLRSVDEKELKQQRAIRKSRGGLVQEVEKTVLGDLQREIDDIIGGELNG